MEKLIYIGIILLFISIILIFIGSITTTQKSNIKVAAGGFIGPIPFGFFTDKKMFYLFIVLFIILMILFIVLKKSLFS
jgi:uncharacterized membrane protein